MDNMLPRRDLKRLQRHLAAVHINQGKNRIVLKGDVINSLADLYHHYGIDSSWIDNKKTYLMHYNGDDCVLITEA